MEKITAAVDSWLKDRPTMELNNTPVQILHLLCAEVGELCEAGGTQTNTELKQNKEFHRELADVLLFTLSLFRQLGVDPVEETMDKVAFNMLRYPAKDYQETPFEEAMAMNRERTSMIGLKGEFYKSPVHTPYSVTVYQ